MGEKKVKIKGEDVELSGVLHVPDGGGSSLVIAFHGFESFKDSPKYIMMGNEFAKAGFYFLRFDFRGCGETPGDKYDLEGRIKDATSALKFAEDIAERIYFVGSSLGGTIAILLGENAKGVVALCPPPVDIGNMRISDALKKNPPLLVIHGDKDETVPISDGKKIYDMARPPKEFFKVEGGDHRFTNPEHLRAVINKSVEFIKKLEQSKQIK